MTDRTEGTDWRQLAPAVLERGYDNSGAVAESAAIVAGWQARSARMRLAHPAGLDLGYGPRPRNRIDFLKAGPDAPTLVFIHGGYWQRRAKEDFACCAAGPLARGVNVALVGYTLAPEATLDQMVTEVRAALDYLCAALPGLGADPERMHLCGWSAGAHLLAMVQDHRCVRSGLAISGIYDLDPMLHISVNAALGLDAAAARRNSPMHLPPRGTAPLVLVAGEAELPLMRRQTAEFADRCRAEGRPARHEEIAGADHFTILAELERPEGRLAALVAELTGV